MPETCITSGCNRPRVGQQTNDALSALGLVSEHCDTCTNMLLHELVAQASDAHHKDHFSAEMRTKRVA